MRLKAKTKYFFKEFYLEIFVFFTFILVRIPRLGFDIINTDAPVWKTRTFVFSNAIFSGDFAGTNVTYHPGVTLTWISAWGVKFYNLYADLFLGGVAPETVQGYIGLHFTQKLLLVIFYAFLISISVFLVRKIFNRNFALIFFFIFTFEPFVLAFTRVLHTDALITTTSFASVLSYFYYNKSKKSFWLIASGFFAGLGLLTKSNALFLVGFLGVCVFVFNVLQSKNVRIFFVNCLRQYLIWLAVAVFTFILFWPAMWVTPAATIQNYYNGIVNIGLESHYQAWFGVEVADPGPTFYPIVLFIRLTPLFILFAGSGVVLTFYNFFRYKKLNPYLLLSLVFVVLYIFFLSISDKKLGRYALPTIPFLSLFVTYTVMQIVKALKLSSFKLVIGKYISITIYVLISLFIFVFSIFSTSRLFPDYTMYYSPLVGGYRGGSNIEELKWPVGYSKLANYLNNLPNADKRYILVRYGYLYNPYNISGETGTLSQRTEKDPGAYFVLEKYSDFRYLKGKNFRLVDVLQVGGVDYFWIYEITGSNEFSKSYKFTFPPGMQVNEDY